MLVLKFGRTSVRNQSPFTHLREAIPENNKVCRHAAERNALWQDEPGQIDSAPDVANNLRHLAQPGNRGSQVTVNLQLECEK